MEIEAWFAATWSQAFAWIDSGLAVRFDEEFLRLPSRTRAIWPGQDHWHAAAGDTFLEHIAMLENADDPTDTTVWKE